MDPFGAAGLQPASTGAWCGATCSRRWWPKSGQGATTAGKSTARGPNRDAALTFRVMVARARRSEADPVGRGTYRVRSGTALGGELRHGGQPDTRRERLVHLAAFPVERR